MDHVLRFIGGALVGAACAGSVGSLLAGIGGVVLLTLAPHFSRRW